MKFALANWKMNGDLALVRSFIEKFNQKNNKCTVVVCPPTALIRAFCGFVHEIGAQNCFYEKKGAFTGETSPELIKQMGCNYVILGHSERRAIFGESDEFIFKKWKAAIEHKLTPILCIGEKSEERSNWKNVLAAQLENYCNESLNLQGTIFAYEPVWSIGTGKVPSSAEISEALNFVRDTLGRSGNYHVVYGGSVNGANSANILQIDGIDGVLVGSASLKLDDFEAIINSASV